ncbi:hypothetical protein ACLD0W_12645 [Alloalcanivorax sp. C16-1]|uniref:hypothetical protein n=1 Tax=Alloalcanivorax sp. C16-1 TaxID=3390051 RepID=UPI0039706612
MFHLMPLLHEWELGPVIGRSQAAGSVVVEPAEPAGAGCGVMARRRLAVRIQVVQAWWLPAYIRGVTLMAVVTGLEPHPDKVACWLGKGLKIKVVNS